MCSFYYFLRKQIPTAELLCASAFLRLSLPCAKSPSKRTVPIYMPSAAYERAGFPKSCQNWVLVFKEGLIFAKLIDKTWYLIVCLFSSRNSKFLNQVGPRNWILTWRFGFIYLFIYLSVTFMKLHFKVKPLT